MREIKFRAWDKIAKKFLWPWPEGFHVLGETTCFDLIGTQLKERNPEATILELLNDIEIMQYTGQNDKNDAEEWEGDICKFGHRKSNQEIGVIVFEQNFCAFGCWSKRSEHPLFYFCREDFEVIGNKFENPELLEKP